MRPGFAELDRAVWQIEESRSTHDFAREVADDRVPIRFSAMAGISRCALRTEQEQGTSVHTGLLLASNLARALSISGMRAFAHHARVRIVSIIPRPNSVQFIVNVRRTGRKHRARDEAVALQAAQRKGQHSLRNAPDHGPSVLGMHAFHLPAPGSILKTLRTEGT
jgi:hypothetical protein